MNMNNLVTHLIIVLLPLICSNVLHMLVVKKDFFMLLNRPISNTLFGKNKTWRGLIFVTISNAILLVVINYMFHLGVEHPFYLGFLLGLAYIVFELPNSFIKRKLGIQPGQQHQRHKIAFSLIDKMDSSFGVIITYYLLGYVNFQLALILFISGSFTHILISKILVIIKIKKSF